MRTGGRTCARGRGGRFEKNLDVTVRQEFFDGVAASASGSAGHWRQVGGDGFAVDREKHQLERARQADRFVFDLEYAFGGLGVNRLWVHRIQP